MPFKFITWEMLSEWDLQTYGDGDVLGTTAKTFQTQIS